MYAKKTEYYQIHWLRLLVYYFFGLLYLGHLLMDPLVTDPLVPQYLSDIKQIFKSIGILCEISLTANAQGS